MNELNMNFRNKRVLFAIKPPTTVDLVHYYYWPTDIMIGPRNKYSFVIMKGFTYVDAAINTNKSPHDGMMFIEYTNPQNNCDKVYINNGLKVSTEMPDNCLDNPSQFMSRNPNNINGSSGGVKTSNPIYDVAN